MKNGIGAEVFLFLVSFSRKQFCSCVRPVTLIYCVKMVTFFSFVCQRPKYRMLVYWLYILNVNFQLSVLYEPISSYNSVLYNAFKVTADFWKKNWKKK